MNPKEQLKKAFEGFAALLISLPIVPLSANPRGLSARGVAAFEVTKNFASKDWRIRRAAVNSLAQGSGEEAMPLIASALQDQNENVRGAAVYALARAGGESVIPFLATALADPNLCVRLDAVRMLASVGGESVVPLLVQALRDKSVEVRRCAVYALEDIGVTIAINGWTDIEAIDGDLWGLYRDALMPVPIPNDAFMNTPRDESQGPKP